MENDASAATVQNGDISLPEAVSSSSTIVEQSIASSSDEVSSPSSLPADADCDSPDIADPVPEGLGTTTARVDEIQSEEISG